MSELSIEEINEQLDLLSRSHKRYYHLNPKHTNHSAEQRPIMTFFYQNLHPLELKWLVRIILRRKLPLIL
jgi:hypothetical protein